MDLNEYDAVDQALAELYAQGTSFRFEKNWREAVRREEQTQMKQNKKNVWKKVVLPVAAALVLVLGAGWAGQMNYPSVSDSVMGTREGRSEKSASDTVYFSNAPAAGSVMMSLSASKDAVYEEASYEEAPAPAPNSGMAADTGSGMETVVQDQRKLIRTVDISLRSENFDADVEGIQQLLNQYGGYIENLNLHGEADSRYGRSANLTMRVPSQHLDAFLVGMDGFGRVTSRSESTQDMTEQYADNETRIQTLRTKMERLNTLLSQAEVVTDILEIENEIAETQYRLESYESRQLTIDRQVDMSYVYVNVQETVVQDDVDDEELTLGQRLKAALKASLEGSGRFLRNLLVFMVMLLPWAVPVALIWLIVRLVQKNRKAAKKADDQAGDELPARDLLADLNAGEVDEASEDTEE